MSGSEVPVLGSVLRVLEEVLCDVVEGAVLWYVVEGAVLWYVDVL
jgi:hypothetical protein